MTRSSAADGHASAISKASISPNLLPQSRELGEPLPEERVDGSEVASKSVPVAKSWPHFVAGG